MGAIRRLTTHMQTVRSAIRLRRTIPIYTGPTLVLASTGAPLEVFADGASDVPGVQITNSEVWGVRWNNHAAPLGVAVNVPLPQDLDIIYPVDVNVLVSKTGATAGDITSLTLACYVIAAAALHDADSDCGGVMEAVTPDATAKRVAKLHRRIQPGDLLAPPCALAMSLTPTAGTLGTDDFLLHSFWLEYTSKYI